MRVAAKSDPGLVRPRNEDDCSFGALQGGAVWAALCDGMGGAAGGSVASQLAVRCIGDVIQKEYHPEIRAAEIHALLRGAVLRANSTVYLLSQNNRELAGMGTTAVAVLATAEMVHICHAGDSRCYLFSADTCKRLTKDHSVVQLMVDSGQITQEEAALHPRKNLITRAVGVDETISTELRDTVFPHGARLLLCSDGLTNMVEDARLHTLCARDLPLQTIADDLVDAANTAGGTDNITVVLIENSADGA
jgi:protein phosphatase